MAPSLINRESQPKLTTWLFEEGTFVPMAKFVGKHSYSIAYGYLGRPTATYDEPQSVIRVSVFRKILNNR